MKTVFCCHVCKFIRGSPGYPSKKNVFIHAPEIQNLQQFSTRSNSESTSNRAEDGAENSGNKPGNGEQVKDELDIKSFTSSHRRRNVLFGSRSSVSPVQRLNKILPPEYQAANLDETVTHDEEQLTKQEGDEICQMENDQTDKRDISRDASNTVLENSQSKEQESEGYFQRNVNAMRSKARHVSPLERLKSKLPKDFDPDQN